MTKVISFVAIVALALAFTSCSNKNSETTVGQNVRPDAVKLVPHPDTLLTSWEKERQVEEKNKAVSKSQEVPVGTENFEKMVEYIWKHGFTITGGPNEIPCGKQYTFFDSKGNRHAYLAIKTDTVTKQASMTGKVQNIFTYGYRKGIKDQEHFFPYDINATSMYCPILEIDGTWEGVKEATFGYNEFLVKVTK